MKEQAMKALKRAMRAPKAVFNFFGDKIEGEMRARDEKIEQFKRDSGYMSVPERTGQMFDRIEDDLERKNKEKGLRRNHPVMNVGRRISK